MPDWRWDDDKSTHVCSCGEEFDLLFYWEEHAQNSCPERGVLKEGNQMPREIYLEYSQAVDDEQGMRLIGATSTNRNLAKVGIADTPGAYIVSHWVTDWKRDNG